MENQSPICQPECKEKDFYNKNNQCFSACDDKALPEGETSTGEFYYYLKDSSKKFFYCENRDRCPDTHPYKYKNNNLCLKSCSETELILSKKTYLYINNICVDDCYNEDPALFSDEDSSSCVDDCSKTHNIFHYNHKCKSSCENYYYLKSTIDSPSSTDLGNGYKELECVDKCPDGFYLYLNSICLQYCPKSSNTPFINTERKKCITCNVPQAETPQEGEGFINNEDLEENKDNIVCHKKCPSNTYYKKNDNKCYPLPSNDDKCYFQSDKPPIVCYPSCRDINEELGDNKYKYEYQNLCYETNICETNNKYYYKIGNYIKCINDEDEDDPEIKMKKIIRECEKQNLYYLSGKECISSCKNTEYKIEPIVTIYRGLEKFGKCCENPNCDEIYKFYSEPERILNNSCSLKTIENEDEEIVKKAGNCVSECPSNTYESVDGKTCLLKCPKYYYRIGQTKKCINNCKSINMYNFENAQECLTNCSKTEGNDINYYYYDDNSNICYELCKDNKDNTANKFSMMEANFPQKCLSSCPDNYYYYTSDYKCRKSCSGGYYENTTSKICVTQCPSTKSILSNNTCIETCPSEEPFFIFKDYVKKCVATCGNELKYHYDTKQCLENCTNDAPYIYGKECINKCPPEYYAESNECKLKCDESSYFVQDTDNVYKCVQNCDLTKYYVSSSTGKCVDKCERWENFVGKNKRCKDSCEEEEYYKKIDEGVFEGKSYDIYQCLQNYGSNSEYLIYGTKKIVNQCPDDYYLSKNGNICYRKCIYDKTMSLPFSTEEEDESHIKKKICSYECKDPDKLKYGEDKICLENCDSLPITKIINDENNECVAQCNLNSSYKFETKSKNDNKMHCSTKCEIDSEQK